MHRTEWLTGRRALFGLATAAVLAFVACAQQTSATSTGTVAAMEMAEAPMLNLPRGLDAVPGDDPRATRDYLLRLPWGDGLPDSLLVERHYPLSNGDSSLIRIVPMMLSWQVDWGAIRARSKWGQFVAKIYNLENKPIDELGLAGLGTGYVWVGWVRRPGAPTAEIGAAIYEIKNNGRVERVPAHLQFGNTCGEPHFKPKVELTDGKKCGAGTGVIGERRLASTEMPAGAVLQAGRGLWVSCTAGCCEIRAQ